MRSETGLRRLVNFSDAVVAIAITLLILPLVDAAGTIGASGVGHFLDANKAKLLAFGLSFAVIGNFWWAQHQQFERVKKYNAVLVGGMFLWLFSIVFLPFPTELLGATQHGSTATNAIYIGTLLVATIAGLVQQWAIVRWPDLQDDAVRGEATLASGLISTGIMAVVFVCVVAIPAIGLWSLLLLLASRPLERVISRTRQPQE
jgi:uncharacterized membrane protein